MKEMWVAAIYFAAAFGVATATDTLDTMLLRQRIQHFQLTLDFHHKIIYSIEESSVMPTPSPLTARPGDVTLAHTTKPDADTCHVHLTPRAAQRAAMVAHEVCHCHLDWDELGATGYVRRLSKHEYIEREMKARACETWLTSDAPEHTRQRREGRIPIFTKDKEVESR